MDNFLLLVQRINNLVHINEVMDFIGHDFFKQTPEQTVYSCLWHSDSTPSFNVNNERNVFHCLGCSKSGSTYGLVKLYLMSMYEDRKITFEEIKTFLSQINPEVKSIKWVVYRPLEINKDKKQDFKSLLDIVEIEKNIFVTSCEEKQRLIAGIMRGLDRDSLNVFTKGKKKSISLLNQLLEESDEDGNIL